LTDGSFIIFLFFSAKLSYLDDGCRNQNCSCPFGLFAVSKSNWESALSSPQKTKNALDEQTMQVSFCFSISRAQFSGSRTSKTSNAAVCQTYFSVLYAGRKVWLDHQIIKTYYTSLNGVNGFDMCSRMIGSDIEFWIKLEINPTFLDALDGDLDL